MKFQILGTGCPKCKTLAAIAEKAIKDLGLKAEMVKVTRIRKINDLRCNAAHSSG